MVVLRTTPHWSVRMTSCNFRLLTWEQQIKITFTAWVRTKNKFQIVIMGHGDSLSYFILSWSSLEQCPNYWVNLRYGCCRASIQCTCTTAIFKRIMVQTFLVRFSLPRRGSFWSRKMEIVARKTEQNKCKNEKLATHGSAPARFTLYFFQYLLRSIKKSNESCDRGTAGERTLGFQSFKICLPQRNKPDTCYHRLTILFSLTEKRENWCTF